MNKNQLKKVISNLQTYVDNKIDNLPASYEEKLLITVPKESIDKSKVATATDENPYTINIPRNGFEYVEGMFKNADIIIEYNGKKYMNTEAVYNSINDVYFIESENNSFAFNIIKDNSSDIQLAIVKLDTTNITDIKLYMRKKDININDLKVNNSISIGRVGNTIMGSSAIGYNVEALGMYSHAEGNGTKASGESAHAEGYNTISSASFGSHAEGNSTKASGDSSHAEGNGTKASGESSHAEGYNTKASSQYQHVQGKYNIEDTANKYAHIVGNGKNDKSTNYKEVRSNAHTLDWEGNAWFAGEVQGSNIPHVISEETVLTVPASSIDKTKAAAASADAPYKLDVSSVFTMDDTKEYFITYGGKTFNIDNDDINIRVGYNAEGTEDATKTQIVIYKLDTTNVTDIKVVAKEIQYLDDLYLDKDLKIKNSISVGNRMGAIGKYSSAIGTNVIASGDSSHAEGGYTKASGNGSHAEGASTTASGKGSHAEGTSTEASGNASHAEGTFTLASGNASHAEGAGTTASNDYSHAEGYNTKASSENQHVQGRYNIEDTTNKYAHIVGNGKNDSSTNFEEVRSNAHTLDWEGNAWYAGKLSQEGTPTEDKDLVTKKYVDDSHPRIVNEYTIELTADELNALHADAYYGTASSYSVMVSSYNFNFNDISHVEVFVKFKDKLLYIKDHCYYNNFYFRKNIVTGADGEYFANIYIEEQNYKFTEGITIYLKEVSTYYSSVFNPNDVVIGNSITIGGRNYADAYGYKIGQFSAAIGSNVRAPYDGSVAIGINTAADNNYAFASGEGTIAGDRGSHAEGYNTVANGEYSHAEGESTHATGKFSHAEGGGTNANSIGSHAEGQDTVAYGDYSHVEGKSTNSYGASYLHVQGMYNADRDYKDAKKYAHIVGNGHYDEETKTEVRSDAHTLDWEGNAWYSGKLTVGKDPEEDMDVTTKKYVDEHSISVIDGFTMRDQTTNYKYLMQLRDGVLTSILLPSSISVDSSSLTNLMEGDVIEGNNLTINATYPDGTTSALSDSDKENITCTPKELTTDVKQITVKYKVGDYELTQTINVTVSAFDPAVKLQDFNYTSNADGTYTLTGWKETHNGVASTEMIIPNNKKIIL